VRYGINRMLVSLRNPTAQQSRSQLKKPSLPQQDLTEGVAGDSPLISTFGKPQPLKARGQPVYFVFILRGIWGSRLAYLEIPLSLQLQRDRDLRRLCVYDA
jgi:hypothetical protein